MHQPENRRSRGGDRFWCCVLFQDVEGFCRHCRGRHAYSPPLLSSSLELLENKDSGGKNNSYFDQSKGKDNIKITIKSRCLLCEENLAKQNQK